MKTGKSIHFAKSHSGTFNQNRLSETPLDVNTWLNFAKQFLSPRAGCVQYPLDASPTVRYIATTQPHAPNQNIFSKVNVIAILGG